MFRTRAIFLLARLTSSILLGLYIYLFLYAYRHFAVKLYSYLRLVADSEDTWELIFSIALTYAVMWILPHSLSRASDFFAWFIFSIVFVPAMTISGVVGNLPNGSYLLTMLLALSFSMIVLIPRLLVLPSIRPFSLPGLISPRSIAWVSVLFSLLIVAQFHSIMSFTGIEAIYDQRAIAKEFGIGRFVGYVLNWQYGVVGAILLAHGLTTKKRGYVLFSLQAFLIIYMVNGAKIVFAVVGMTIAVHILLRFRAVTRPYLLMVPAAVVSLLISVMVQIMGHGFSDAVLFFLSQIYMRAIAIQGALLPVFVEFFETHPLTYYSHVTGISSFVHYPYTESIGHVIGYYVNGNPEYNANSNFWATDGIAALGMIGIPIVGVIVGLTLSVIDGLTKRADKPFLFLAMVPFLMAVANNSLFTALITGGGILVAVLARYIHPETLRTQPLDP